VVRRRVRNKQERLALPLHVVVECESVYLDVWHARYLLAAAHIIPAGN
jgi:hypothetical protein